MSLRERVADFIRGGSPKIVNSATPLSQITLNSSTWGDFVDSLGKLPPLTESTALTLPAVYACINLIAGAIASLPILIYKLNLADGERTRIYETQFHWIFNEQMTPRWQSAAGWEFLVQSLLLHGDAFAIIHRNNMGEPIGLEPVHPSRVYVFTTPDKMRLIYRIGPEPVLGVVQPDPVSKTYDQDDILHVPGFGFNGLRGLSPLRNALRMTGSASMAMQDFAANFFANSARPDYALTTAQSMGQERVDQLRQQIDDNHRTTANAHRPMLLHSGLDIKNITMPLEDMQLLGMRQFQIEDIARIYGVPPFMIGHNEKTTSWGSGVESMGTGFVRYTLRQHLTKFQNEINRKLFRIATRVAEFDTTDLERADTKSFYEGLRIAMGRAGEKPMISINEARAEMRRNKIAGGDSFEIDPMAGAKPNEPQQTV